MTSRPRTTRRLLSLVVVLALTASGCGFFHKGADARKAAESLARGLQDGDVGKVRFTQAQAAQDYAALVKGVGASRTRVSVDQVTRSGDSATATLSWSVDLDGHVWKHQTSATLLDQRGTWRVAWKPSILEKSLAAGETLQVSRVEPHRGDILGRGDAPLVTARPVIRFGIDRAKVSAAAAPGSARQLATLLGISVAPYVDAVAKAGPQAFVPALVLRRADATQRLLAGTTAIPGARAISDHLPLAPTKEFAAAVLGTVGPATEELIAKSGGRLHVGEDTGLSGLELRHDQTLSGSPGITVSAVPATPKAGEQAGTPRTLFEAAAVPGKDLHTTLDPVLEQKADDLLAHVGPASAVVALQPSTGAVLAAASGPGSKGYNTATFGRYAPGSTFKVVSALALLRSGLTPDSRVSCTPTIVVNGKQFKNYSDYPPGRMGQITLRDALANSCNTGFISQHARLQGTDLADAAAALGVGVDHDLGFPAFFGQVPPPASETEGAADMIGQGKVLASPMAMAAVAASVMNGATVVPNLVSAAPGAAAATPSPGDPLTAAEAGQLRAMMHAVVMEGSGAILQSLQPPTVIAKTGTAEYGSKVPLPTHAWMIAAQGDLAVAVFVATGESGSHTAGPILQAFLRAAKG